MHIARNKLLIFSALSIIMGQIVIVLFVLGASGESYLFADLSTLQAISLGAASTGVLLGFLFGIPRTLQHDIAPPATNARDDADGIRYQINTNLEQISDWLTKIIVGVGLVQLGSIGSWLINFSGRVSISFDSPILGQPFVASLILYFMIAGFLSGYLWTRLHFGSAIKEADRGLVERRIEAVEEAIRADHHAAQVIARQLSGSRDQEAVPFEELRDALARSSRPIKVKAFYDAVAARTEGRREEAIPILRALIADDTNARYHRNYAELGIALRNSALANKNPTLMQEAEKTLTKAIDIRNAASISGYGYYEFWRAMCRIHLGYEKDSIEQDLRTAAKSPLMKRKDFDSTLNEWLSANGLSRDALGFS